MTGEKEEHTSRFETTRTPPRRATAELPYRPAGYPLDAGEEGISEVGQCHPLRRNTARYGPSEDTAFRGGSLPAGGGRRSG